MTMKTNTFQFLEGLHAWVQLTFQVTLQLEQ